MAESSSSITTPTSETLTRTIEECGIVDDGKPLHLLMIGPPGVGKSSLAGVLINGVSKGVAGPDAGTTENIKSTEVRANNGITYIVHDTRGLDGNEEKTQRTIDEMKKLIINEKYIIFVCARWDVRFTDCITTFEVTNQLSPDIWEKAVIVLTHSDCLSPDVRKLPDDQQDQRIEELNECWKKNIKAELSRLGVNEDTLDNLKICNTSHTSIDETWYRKNWLEELTAELLKVLPSCNDVTNTILSQVANLHPEHRELVDALISSIDGTDITLVNDDLTNFPPENSTHFSKREKVCRVLIPIGLCVAGAGIVAVVGRLLCKYSEIAASVAIDAGAGVGIDGVGLLLGIGIVGVYFLYKLYSRNN